MIETMRKWIFNTNEAEKELDQFAAELFEVLTTDLEQIEKYPTREKELIESGYGFIDEPENGLGHISKDLWKGYALGYMRALIDEELAGDGEDAD